MLRTKLIVPVCSIALIYGCATPPAAQTTPQPSQTESPATAAQKESKQSGDPLEALFTPFTSLNCGEHFPAGAITDAPYGYQSLQLVNTLKAGASADSVQQEMAAIVQPDSNYQPNGQGQGSLVYTGAHQNGIGYKIELIFTDEQDYQDGVPVANQSRLDRLRAGQSQQPTAAPTRLTKARLELDTPEGNEPCVLEREF